MSELITYTAVLLIAACFIAIVVISRLANDYRTERWGWMLAFQHLMENPGDVRGAMEIVSHATKTSKELARRSIAFQESVNRGK